MDYPTALKTVEQSKTQSNFMTMEFSYNLMIVLPHKAGLAIIEALNQAEVYDTNYSRDSTISPLEQKHFKANFLPISEYRQIKMAALLGITVQELNTTAAVSNQV